MGEGLIQAYFEHGPVQDIVSMEKEFRLTLPNGTPMVGFLDFIVDRGEGLEVVELKTAAPDRLAGLPHGASTIPRTWILKPPTPLDGLSSSSLAPPSFHMQTALSAQLTLFVAALASLGGSALGGQTSNEKEIVASTVVLGSDEHTSFLEDWFETVGFSSEVRKL